MTNESSVADTLKTIISNSKKVQRTPEILPRIPGVSNTSLDGDSLVLTFKKDVDVQFLHKIVETEKGYITVNVYVDGEKGISPVEGSIHVSAQDRPHYTGKFTRNTIGIDRRTAPTFFERYINGVQIPTESARL